MSDTTEKSISYDDCRVMFEHNPLPMFIYDIDTLAFINVNEAALRHYGYTREEFLSMTVKDIRPPEDVPAFLDTVSKLSPGLSGKHEGRHLKKDGSIIYVEVVGYRIAMDGQKAELATVMDVTERIKAEERLELFRTLIDQSNDFIALIDPQTSRFIYVNDSARGSYGYSPEEMLQMRAIDLDADLPDLDAWRSHVAEVREKGAQVTDGVHRRKDGRTFPVEVNVRYVSVGENEYMVAVARDITRRRRAEQEMQRAVVQLLTEKAKTDSIIAAIGDGISIQDRDFKIVYQNQAMRELVGDHVGEHCYEVYEREQAVCIGCPVAMAYSDGKVHTEERAGITDKGKVYVEVTASPLKDAEGNIIGGIEVVRDITERKKINSYLSETKEFLEAVIHASPVAIMTLDSDGKITLWNEASEKIFGWRQEEVIGEIPKFVPKEKMDEFHAIRNRVIHGEEIKGIELRRQRKDGSLVETRLFVSPTHDAKGNVTGIMALIEDITEQKRINMELKKRIGQQAAVAQLGQIALAGEGINSFLSEAVKLVADVLGAEYCKVLELLPEDDELLLKAGVGFREDLVGLARVDAKSSQAGYTLTAGKPVVVEDYASETRFGIPPLLKEHGIVSGMSVVIGSKESPYGILGVHTAEKRFFTEDDAYFLEAVANTLADAIERWKMDASLLQSKRDWEDIFDTITDMITFHDKDFNIIRANKAAQKILGLPLIKMDKAKCYAHYHGTGCPPESCPSCQTIKTGQTAVFELFEPHLNMEMEIRSIPRLGPDGELTGLIHVVRDISERKRAEERIRNNLKRLESLHSIDMAISASLDLGLTMNVILEQVTSQLEVDAADILLYSPATKTLAYAVGRGFRTSGIKKSRVRIGEGCAGGAALERRIVNISAFEDSKDFTRSGLLEGEGFMSAYHAPLIAKGEVKGVLEVYHRKRLAPDADWMEFLETLSTQAAIAIDNSTLFNDLQRSNTEISVAYDATIEGWARALDYRDKETEGHSRRVTEMTVDVAREMGLDESRIEHVRRGALLHDIGKLGVPDSVLFKPGKLDEEEWKLMKKHPILAYELLHPIAFLRPAIDIPYCHHEKWDGTGYPRGLKAERIPIAARIFSVIDVWDALRSDRPYRPAWTIEKTINYLKNLAGVEFDPEVVRVFLAIRERQGF